MTEAQQTEPESTSEGSVETLLTTEVLETAEEAASEPESEQPPAEEATEEAEQKPETPEGAPEKYEFTAPEGVDLAADSAAVTAFEGVAKELNLTQAQAQAVIDKVLPAIQGQRESYVDGIAQAWAEEAKVDSEIGGEKLAAHLAKANAVLSAYAPKELIAVLSDPASPGRFMGNSKHLIKMLARIRDDISDDRFVAGGAGEAPKAPKRFYDKSEMNV